MSSVFVSYSHKDAEWLEKLQPFLDPLKSDGKLRVFEDTGLQPGDDWRQEIDQALAEADRAILLVSQDFLASEFIKQVELPRLIEAAESRRLRILPIIVRPVAYHSSALAGFQAVNDPSRTLLDMSEPEQERKFIQVAAMVTRSSPPTPESPRGASPPDPAIPATKEVRSWLLARKLNVYLGSWTAIGDPETPPTPGELMGELLRRWDSPGTSEIVVPVDVLGSYLALRESQSALDELVRQLVSSRSERVPAIHQALAAVLRATQDSEPPRTHRHNQRQLLVVTTNFDLCLERALISDGVDFYRLVQMRGTGDLEVEHFPRARGSVAPDALKESLASFGSPSDMSEATGSGNSVLLFKIHGSVDLEDSCSISCDHYYRSIRNAEHLPEALKGGISRNRDLFLGYSLLDSDLRTLSHSLIRDKIPDEPYRGFFVHARPQENETDTFRSLERVLWSRLQLTARALDLEPLEVNDETFLAELMASMAGVGGG